MIIESDRVACFDCDDTLVLWKWHDMDLPTVVIEGREFQIHAAHLRKIHNYSILGYTIIVWSNSGYKWAQKVAEALGIDDKVIVMCKPHRCFDDAKSLDDTIKHGWLSPDDKGDL